jgi:hypothetical protein
MIRLSLSISPFFATDLLAKGKSDKKKENYLAPRTFVNLHFSQLSISPNCDNEVDSLSGIKNIDA